LGDELAKGIVKKGKELPRCAFSDKLILIHVCHEVSMHV